MKKIMIALTVLGFTWTGAQAQTNNCACPTAKKVAVHKKASHAVLHHTNTVVVNKTYQVCREEGGYYVCCLHKSSEIKPVTSVQPATNPEKTLANK